MKHLAATPNGTTGKSGIAGIVRLRVIALLLVILFVIVIALPPDLTLLMVVENGPVEMLSAIGLLAAAFWLFCRAGRDPSGQPVAAGFLVLLLGLRELDFHARFTTMGVFKTKYYLSPLVPAGEKIIVSLVMAVIVFIAIRFVIGSFRRFTLALRRRRPAALALLAAFGYGLLGKGLDSLATQLAGNPVEQFVQGDEVRPFHVPVRLLGLELQIDRVRQAGVQDLDDLGAGLGG